MSHVFCIHTCWDALFESSCWLPVAGRSAHVQCVRVDGGGVRVAVQTRDAADVCVVCPPSVTDKYSVRRGRQGRARERWGAREKHGVIE